MTRHHPLKRTSVLHAGASVNAGKAQAGISLVVVMMILIIVSILGIGGIQISMMGERATRNDRDMQVAWQSAEAALIDAELDIQGKPATSTNKRNEIFDRKATDFAKFVPGCGTAGDDKSFGLCLPTAGTKPDWLTADFTNTGTDANTVGFGHFTERAFMAGGVGLQPAALPRYVIEIIDDPSMDRTTALKDRKYLYRITAMGFGPNSDTQAVLQTIYRN
ncbi:MAG: PilX N-terminal domain-containing pilus assembly protein [Acidovorax sp.]|uniref:pilus assembly PilX family protein n=1 Tax=Acidovorax sp. TaxID=1872122 RepID=UPI0039E66EFA